MTPRSTRACRALLALVLGACGTLAWWGGTPPAAAAVDCPGAGTCLVVRLVGPSGEQGSTTLTIEQLEDQGGAYGTDLPADTPYRVRLRAGEEPVPIQDLNGGTPRYLSLRALVQALASQPGPFQGLDPDASVSLLRVYLPIKQRDATLPGEALRAAGANPPNPYADGLVPAVIVDDDKLGFVRPLTGGDDVNAGDYSYGASADAYVLTLSTSGRVYAPEVTVDNASPTTEDTVTFGVELDDPPPGATYRWSFGDGSAPVSGPTVTHRFATPSAAGRRVTVSLSADDLSSGSGSLVVPVAAAPDRTELEPRIVFRPSAPQVGTEVVLRVEGVPAGTTYAWRVGTSDRIVSTGAVLRQTFRTADVEVVVRVDVALGARRGRDAVRVPVDAEPPTTPEVPDVPDTGSGGSSEGGQSTDPDAPLTGPDDGVGTDQGGDPAPTEPGSGSPQPPGGLTGILLTGFATPVEALPPSPTEEQADAAAARARMTPGAADSDGGAIRWGLGLLPALLLLGAARESGWVSRLRTSWARA